MTQQASGFTTNYTDPSSGLNLPAAWIQMKIMNYQPYNYVLIVYDIYQDESAYQSNMQPVFPNLRLQTNSGSDNWNIYFDPDVMDLAGHNFQKQCLDLLQSSVN